jgi:CRISPR-associated protein Cas1
VKRHLNTLYITTQGSYLAREREAVLVRVEEETRLRVPIHMLDGIVCFGRVSMSPALMGLCGERGVGVSFLTENGRFLARIEGTASGNVLLRREQYRRADDPEASTEIARSMITAKVANSRAVLLRAARDSPAGASKERADRLRGAARQMKRVFDDLDRATELAVVRGIEGEAARLYFSVLDLMITSKDEAFRFAGRNRRPPLDPVNCLLSFLYTLLVHDTSSACAVVGLDPAAGFLHRDRPGRPGLALDLMEELRPFLADRLALSLINTGQIKPNGFTTTETGAVLMDDDARKLLLVAYQKRKQEEITHPFLDEKVTIGMIIHLQARLLSRHLRGDLDAYPPFLWR